MIIPVVHHTVIAKTLPPVIKVVHEPCPDCSTCPTCECCQHVEPPKDDGVAELAGKALERLGGKSGTTVEGSAVGDIAKKALEKVGGDEKEESVADLANRALEKLDGPKDDLADVAAKALKGKGSKSKSSSDSGDSVGDLARRALKKLNLP